MDTKSSVRGVALLLAGGFAALALLSTGCKTPPANPFLAKHDEANAKGDEAKTPEELAAEVQAAMAATGKAAREAAMATVSDAAARGHDVAVDAATSASQVAQSAAVSAQVRAIEATASWPIEQAGPVLLVALTEGTPVTRRAAAEQLAQRWPPAADFPVDDPDASRAAAIATLRKRWERQYGAINDAVVSAQAQAQDIIDQANHVADQAQQVAYETQQTVQAAGDTVRQVRSAVVALQQANLPEAARQQASVQLEQLAHDARAEVRAQVASTLGDVADQAMVPLLVAMLEDQLAVQQAALDSLTRLTGEDVAAGEPTTEDKVRRWQLWYQEHPQYRTAGK